MTWDGSIFTVNIGNSGYFRIPSGSGQRPGFIVCAYSNFIFSSNVYYNGSNWFYDSTGYGAQVQCETNSSGDISLNTDTYRGGGSTASWNTRIQVKNPGQVGIGTTSPSYRMDIYEDLYIDSGALGVNVAPNATNGRIDASNDIVAFSSDRRLKTNIEPITDALSKVKKLHTFIYTWNELANKVAGFDTDQKYVGVYAQEIQSVLPEAVKLAPFDNDGNNNSISGENYLTVQYEKIVPLLIEAIKEQQKQIEELKNK